MLIIAKVHCIAWAMQRHSIWKAYFSCAPTPCLPMAKMLGNIINQFVPIQIFIDIAENRIAWNEEKTIPQMYLPHLWTNNYKNYSSKKKHSKFCFLFISKIYIQLRAITKVITYVMHVLWCFDCKVKSLRKLFSVGYKMSHKMKKSFSSIFFFVHF